MCGMTDNLKKRLTEEEMTRIGFNIMTKIIQKRLGDEQMLNYCPNCGNSLKKEKKFQQSLGDANAEGFLFDGFDVYCHKCEWSGDIKPDYWDRRLANQGVKEWAIGLAEIDNDTTAGAP